MIIEAAIAVSAGVGALYTALEPFRKTSHGHNPWTLEGFVNAASISRYIKAASELTGASFSSCYRSPQVQRRLYDSKRKDPAKWAVVVSGAEKAGMSVENYVEFLSTRTRHARALAGDFVGKPIGQLATDLHQLALAGKIGPVKKVLDERDHAHVEWYGPGEAVEPPKLERL